MTALAQDLDNVWSSLASLSDTPSRLMLEPPCFRALRDPLRGSTPIEPQETRPNRTASAGLDRRNVKVYISKTLHEKLFGEQKTLYATLDYMVLPIRPFIHFTSEPRGDT